MSGILELEVLDLHARRSDKSESEEEEVIFTATRGLLSETQPNHVMDNDLGEATSSKISLKKHLTVFNGVTLIVGGIIGSGIFFTPKLILCYTGSFGVSMVAWVMGAFIALAGALCFVELGLLVRTSGGDFSFLLEGFSFNRKNKFVTAFGGCVAFLYVWCSCFIIRPGGVAILTLTCAHYLSQSFFIGCTAPDSIVKLIALSVIIIVSAINAFGVKLTAQIIAVVTVLKLFAVSFIVILGIATIISQRSLPEDTQDPFKSREGFELTASSLALALYGVLFSYDGWSSIFFAFEETKNVEKTLPRSLFIGIPIVAVCYLLVNIAYFGVLSYDQVLTGEAIALTFGNAALGKLGLVIVPLMVALSTCGASVGSLYSGSRLSYVAARDGMLPALLSGLHTHYHTPLPAIVFQSVFGGVLVLLGDISDLLSGLGAVTYLFLTLVFTTLLILRVTRRREPRLFKAWFIIPVTLFSILTGVFLTVLPLQQKPGPSLLSFGVMLLGLPVYLFVVMETPWRLRPYLFDVLSNRLTRFTNSLLNTEIAR